jgi:biopolymer transport protein ExbD
MRIKDPMNEGEEPYNLVPLTDMVFNLLIFFMCATTFAQVEKEMTVQLPHASTSFRPLSAPPRQIIINIREDGAPVIAGKTYTNQELTGVLKDALAKDASTSVIVRADERAYVKYFASVAVTCRRAGVGEARFSFIDDAPPGAGAK